MAIIENISQSGMQIACDKETVYSFLPNGKTNPGQNSDIEIRFSEKPNTKGRHSQIRLVVRPIISRRVSQNVYHIGLKYMGLTDKNTQRIFSYIVTLI